MAALAQLLKKTLILKSKRNDEQLSTFVSQNRQELKVSWSTIERNPIVLCSCIVLSCLCDRPLRSWNSFVLRRPNQQSRLI